MIGFFRRKNEYVLLYKINEIFLEGINKIKRSEIN